MGRPRGFDSPAAVAAARDRFVRYGYLGTSVDDLIAATGVQRSSLYHAFGSKRGVLLAALNRATEEPDLDLALVTLVDLAPRDAEVRAILTRLLAGVEDAPRTLGQRVLDRARITEGMTP